MIVQNAIRLAPNLPRGGRPNDAASGPETTTGAGTARGTVVDLPVSDLSASAKQASVEHVRRAAEAINHALRQSNRNLEFRLDEQTNRVVVKLTDTETGEVIRQIPSDEMLAISRAIGEFQQGLLLRQKA